MLCSESTAREGSTCISDQNRHGGPANSVCVGLCHLTTMQHYLMDFDETVYAHAGVVVTCGCDNHV